VSQLVELKKRYSEFEDRGVEVVVVNQEDAGEESRMNMLEALGGDPPFVLASDVDRQSTPRFERVTTYILDPEGRVVEIFPAHRRVWMPWDAVLNRLDELAAGERPTER
jgi:peroxiredoxin